MKKKRNAKKMCDKQVVRMMDCMKGLSDADGWELIDPADYQNCTKEEILQKQKQIKESVLSIIEDM